MLEAEPLFRAPGHVGPGAGQRQDRLVLPRAARGWLAPGDTLSLRDRLHPQWSLARIQDILNRRVLDLPTLAELAALPALSPNWRALFEKRARLGQVEDWQRRLQGDPADASTGTPST